MARVKPTLRRFPRLSNRRRLLCLGKAKANLNCLTDVMACEYLCVD